MSVLATRTTASPGLNFPLSIRFQRMRLSCGVWVRQGHACFGCPVFFETLSAAAADIPETRFQHHLSMSVILVDSVGSDHDPVGFSAGKPFGFFLDGLVRLEHGRFDLCIGVIKPQNEFSIIHFPVGAVDDQSTSMAEGQRAVWIGAKRRTTFPFSAFFNSGSPSLLALVSRFSRRWGASASSTDRTASRPSSPAMALAALTCCATSW